MEGPGMTTAKPTPQAEQHTHATSIHMCDFSVEKPLSQSQPFALLQEACLSCCVSEFEEHVLSPVDTRLQLPWLQLLLHAYPAVPHSSAQPVMHQTSLTCSFTLQRCCEGRLCKPACQVRKGEGKGGTRGQRGGGAGEEGVQGV